MTTTRTTLCIVILYSTALALLCIRRAHAADPIPYFKPDKPTQVVYGPPRPHSIATECAYNDSGCLRQHDERVLDTALMVRDKSACTQAVRALSCMMLYEFIVDDTPGDPDDPMLSDPCTFVVRIDHGYATLYSFREKRGLTIRDLGFEAAEFLGACVVDKMPPLPEHGVQTLQGFPWTKR